MWFGEPHLSPEKGSPTRLSTLGQRKYKGWSCSFKADSFLLLGKSPAPPVRLTLQYQAISLGATSKARYMKHILPILMTYNSKFGSACKGTLRKCFVTDIPSQMQECTEWHLGHLQSVIKTERNQMNSHRHGTYLLVSIKLLHVDLKCYFISISQVLLKHSVFYGWHWPHPLKNNKLWWIIELPKA
jgi:hypothetical protein